MRRWRGLGWLCAALLILVVSAAWLLRSDAPSRHGITGSHAAAGLACGDCHRAPTQTPDCGTCHGAHPSTRTGHGRARASGAMTCTSCHRVHHDVGGVTFSAAGATRFGPGGSVSVPTAASPEVRGTVAVVPLDACAACHDPSADDDPIARCRLAGDMNGCFDEHRRVAGATLGTVTGAQDRLILWTHAREVVARRPEPPTRALSGVDGFAIAVSLAVFVGLLVWSFSGAEPAKRPVATVNVQPPKIRRLPQIDASTCLGCSACVDACPYDVLALDRYVAKVARPEDCCGLTTCAQLCPNGSLVVLDGAPIEDRPGVHATLESVDVPGMFLAGDLTGMPLIRNAINQGAVAVREASVGLTPGRADLDLVIVGAGPAGLSAAMEAKARGLNFVVVEQGTLAASIQSFPRGKLVFDQPLHVPLVGALWLAEATKEELLRQWTRLARQHALPIRTEHRVTSIDPVAEGFAVAAVSADGTVAHWQAQRVVLAIGRRGSPRELDVAIPAPMEPHVHHSLADARSFAGRACVVVGLGDVAMEAALALSYAPQTSVTVVARGDDFRRGKARNIESMRRAQAQGRLSIRWSRSVQAVRAGEVQLDDGSCVPADSVFVMIGSIAPWSFLASVGVRRVGPAPAVVERPRG
ncbi:MAG: NAD(P)-binding domain-containing protein [Myxococcota bacterium]